MTDNALSILKNTISQMACDADDKGLTDFGLRLSVDDAFALCKLATPTQWIPCSERLPEKDGCYLAAIAYTGWIGSRQFSLKIDIPDLGIWENVWWRLDDYCYPDITTGITHWMPLPEPPEEGTGR